MVNSSCWLANVSCGEVGWPSFHLAGMHVEQIDLPADVPSSAWWSIL
jgi:hypothetical protein